jgi:predicted HTH domain antitoxin
MNFHFLSILRIFNCLTFNAMTTMTLQVPEALEKEHDETVRFLAAKLYEAQKLTLGQAAEMCGMKKWDFPAVLAQFDVPYFQYTGQDLLNEFE